MSIKNLGWCILLGLCGSSDLHSQLAYPHDRTASKDTTVVMVFADGNIRSLLNGGNEQSTGGTGFLRLAFVGNNFFFAAQGNFASTVDTLTSQVGATLFSPSYSKAFRSLLLDGRRWLGRGKSGFHAYGGFSVVPWGLKSTTTHFADSAEATVLTAGVGAFHDFFSTPLTDTLGKNHVSVTLELEWAVRKLTGPVADGNHILLQDQLLGTRRTTFTGPSLGTELRVNDIVLAFQLYALFHTRGLEDMSGVRIGAALGGQGSFQKWLLVGGR